MPLRDGTGPMGYGRLTGRGLGPCGSGEFTERSARPISRFFGRFGGRGGGYGRRNWFHATGLPGWARFNVNNESAAGIDPETEKALLKDESAELKRRIDAIGKRVEELDSRT
jgi:hypothetical protein